MKRCNCPHFEPTTIFNGDDYCGYLAQPIADIPQCHLSDMKWGKPNLRTRIWQWLKGAK